MKRSSTVFEVDQSIKIGNLSADTILAYSNHTCGTVRIPVDVKRKALRALRSRGKSTIRATVQVFAAALFFLSIGEAAAQAARFCFARLRFGHGAALL